MFANLLGSVCHFQLLYTFPIYLLVLTTQRTTSSQRRVLKSMHLLPKYVREPTWEFPKYVREPAWEHLPFSVFVYNFTYLFVLTTQTVQ